MAELDSMQTAITQVAIHAATMAEMTLKEADTKPATGTSLANVRKALR